MVRIGLCVPVLHNFQGFAELMQSVDTEVRPIVVDNWNDNTGVSAAWNHGLRSSLATNIDYLFICNDDVVFKSGSMGKMLWGLADHDLVTAYNTRDEDYQKHEFIDSPDYSCFAVEPWKFVNKFGYFDENFFPAYFEDNDMAYRIKLTGGSDKKCTGAPMFHKGSVTQNWEGGQVVTSPVFEMNREHYRQKWGGPPGEERFTKPFNDETLTHKDW